MDESWRMRMRMPTSPPRHTPNYHPRRSDATANRRKPFPGGISDDPSNQEDFSDVFGGPPRSVLSRQSYTRFLRSSSSPGFFYEEVFRPSPTVWRSGRSLPEFRIPGEQGRSNHYQHKREKDGFYTDIFGWDNERVVRSRSWSKTGSSPALSSEEFSPLRPAASANCDDEVPIFASNLRPINVNTTWDSRTMMPPFRSSQKDASPETISLEPIPKSNSSFRVSADESDLNSPSSEVCHLSDRDQKTHKVEDEAFRKNNMESESESESESDDEAMSSYVIEINSDYRDGESNGIDEAIAWAKEKYSQQECHMQKPAEEISNGHQVSEEQTDSLGSSDEQEEVQTELEILDEMVRLWSSGKEDDIRLLLSSLHNILWPNSGWLAIPLANIMEISKVKKAYQKARLCLHPDKLQQRGASLRQKYISEKAFSILQDAWAVFISRTENFTMV